MQRKALRIWTVALLALVACHAPPGAGVAPEALVSVDVMFAQSAPAKPDKTRFAIQAADASVSIGGLGGPAAAFRAARAVPWLSRALRASKPELEVVGTDTNGTTQSVKFQVTNVAFSGGRFLFTTATKGAASTLPKFNAAAARLHVTGVGCRSVSIPRQLDACNPGLQPVLPQAVTRLVISGGKFTVDADSLTVTNVSAITRVATGGLAAVQVSNYAILVSGALRKSTNATAIVAGTTRKGANYAATMLLLDTSFDASKGALVFKVSNVTVLDLAGSGHMGRRLQQSTASVCAAQAGDCTAASIFQSCVVAGQCAAFPYIGTGYDLLSGFPYDYTVKDKGIDPGYLTASPVFTADSISINAAATAGSACSAFYQVAGMGSSSDLQRSAAENLGLGGGYNKTKTKGNTTTTSIAAFGLNFGWSQLSTQSSSQSWATYISTATCSQAEVFLRLKCLAPLDSPSNNLVLDPGFVPWITRLATLMGAAQVPGLSPTKERLAWKAFYSYVASFIESYGTAVVTQATLGGATLSVYQGQASSFLSIKEKGFDWSLSGGVPAANAQTGGNVNKTATDILDGAGITYNGFVTPSGGAVYSSNGHLNTAAWSSFLSSTNLGNLSPLTSAQLSYPELLVCPGSNYLWKGANITVQERAQLAQLMDSFIANCGNATYGVTLPCKPPEPSCVSGYYPTNTSTIAPFCDLCIGGLPGQCNPFGTSCCTGPNQGSALTTCFCKPGVGGPTCSSNCTATGYCKSDGSGCKKVVEADSTCSAQFSYGYGYDKSGCECTCCSAPGGAGVQGNGTCGPEMPSKAEDRLLTCGVQAATGGTVLNTMVGPSGAALPRYGNYNSTCTGCVASLADGALLPTGSGQCGGSGCYVMSCGCASGGQVTQSSISLCQCSARILEYSGPGGGINNCNGTLTCGPCPT